MSLFSRVFIKVRHLFNANLGQQLCAASVLTMEMTGWGFPDLFFKERKRRVWGWLFASRDTFLKLLSVRMWTKPSEMTFGWCTWYEFYKDRWKRANRKGCVSFALSSIFFFFIVPVISFPQIICSYYSAWICSSCPFCVECFVPHFCLSTSCPFFKPLFKLLFWEGVSDCPLEKQMLLFCGLFVPFLQHLSHLDVFCHVPMTMSDIHPLKMGLGFKSHFPHTPQHWAQPMTQ